MVSDPPGHCKNRRHERWLGLAHGQTLLAARIRNVNAISNLPTHNQSNYPEKRVKTPSLASGYSKTHDPCILGSAKHAA